MGTKIEFIEPGVDPTEAEYIPDGPSCSGCLTLGVALIAVFVIGVLLVNFAQSQKAEKPTTPTAYVIPTDTNTPRPTSTGTVTPQPPTATVQPSETPRPSETPTFIPPPKLPKVITATSFVTPPGVMTATAILDRREFSTATPQTFLAQRKAYLKDATATARANLSKPTETPAG